MQSSTMRSCQCLQGDCDSVSAPPLEPGEAKLRPRQCVLTMGQRTLFGWGLKDTPLWIHNLYFRTATRLLEIFHSTAPVWLSQLTVQQLGDTSGIETSIYVISVSQLLVQGACPRSVMYVFKLH